MNSTLLAVIGGVLLLGLAVFGLISWGWGHQAPMSAAMTQGQYNTVPMGRGMMSGQSYGPGMMGSGMMGQMMQGRGMQNQGCGMGMMHGAMMGNQGHGSGMSGSWGCTTPPGQAYAPTTPQQPEVVETNAIELKGFAFNPPVIRVKKGTTVTWANMDNVPHTVTASDGSFRSGLLNQNQSWSFTFDKPGIYSYFCEPHPYMQGQIIVEDEAGK